MEQVIQPFHFIPEIHQDGEMGLRYGQIIREPIDKPSYVFPSRVGHRGASFVVYASGYASGG
jgi:hypothetical protein